MYYLDKIKDFREKIASLDRESIIEIISEQNPYLIKQITRIEWVFSHKLLHLTWPDGSPITERYLTNEELALLVDMPFEVDEDLTQMGLTPEQQYELHVVQDPVTWSRHFMGAVPRLYQILMLRHPNNRKVLRAGRRLGKSWTMAVKMLHYAFTHNKGKILVLAPMKSHVDLLYKAVKELIDKSDMLKESVKRAVTSPQYELEFTNGSTIKFFTSGMRSGGKADVARGQEAHLIVLDEMDYMAPEDLDAIYVMLQKTDESQIEEKELIGASTPTGLRERFWKWCHSERFQEFWFPSYCNPSFTKEVEEEFREEYTEMIYRHEIEADWGEVAEGVYLKRWVDKAYNSGSAIAPPDSDWEEVAALSDWEYKLERVEEDSNIVIGVDWDKTSAGVSIVILEICSPNCHDKRFAGRVRLMYREETPKEEFTLNNGLERVKQLNAILNPKFIYVDRGYGDLQVEQLHLYGKEHPETGLRSKVKGISPASSIEVRDPATREKVKKHVKVFKVHNLISMLEREQIVIPNHDEDLYLQLTSYIVARNTSTGMPVFEMPGGLPDHAHDAFLLAVMAIAENWGFLMRKTFSKMSVPVSSEGISSLSTKDTSSSKAKKAAPTGPARRTRMMSANINKSRRQPIKRTMI